jgi:hypothetical protein
MEDFLLESCLSINDVEGDRLKKKEELKTYMEEFLQINFK